MVRFVLAVAFVVFSVASAGAGCEEARHPLYAQRAWPEENSRVFAALAEVRRRLEFDGPIQACTTALPSLPNAFVSPGSNGVFYLVVHPQIAAVLGNEELAAIVAHEVGHLKLGHLLHAPPDDEGKLMVREKDADAYARVAFGVKPIYTGLQKIMQQFTIAARKTSAGTGIVFGGANEQVRQRLEALR